MSDKQTSLFPNTPNTRDTANVLQGLDRSEVEPLAFKILDTIGPYCLRCDIAGSFRRQKQIVNDLDIVVQLKPLPLYWLQMVKVVRSEFGALTVKQGDKLATLNVPFASKQGQGYVQVDLYRADPNTWGILLLVRTGSKEHNVKLCNLAISKGLRLQYSVGFTDKYGNVVAGRQDRLVIQIFPQKILRDDPQNPHDHGPHRHRKPFCRILRARVGA